MKASKAAAILVVAVFIMSLFAVTVTAEEKISIRGKIKDYDLGAKTLVVTTTDGKEIALTVENETALKKLDDRLFKDDEVKVKYIVNDGKNVIKGSNDLKGTKAGC